MYAIPDVDEVVAVAKALGIHLGPEEAVLYQKYLLEQLAALDTFVQTRVEESTPPMVAAARQPGAAATRRRPAQRLDVEVPHRGGNRRLAGRQDRQLQGPHRGGRDAHELRLLRP